MADRQDRKAMFNTVGERIGDAFDATMMSTGCVARPMCHSLPGVYSSHRPTAETSAYARIDSSVPNARPPRGRKRRALIDAGKRSRREEAVPMQFTVGLKLQGKTDRVLVEAEDALIAALKVKTERPEAVIIYVRRQNRRGDARHPSHSLAEDTR
jgi:hypothetical protein